MANEIQVRFDGLHIFSYDYAEYVRRLREQAVKIYRDNFPQTTEYVEVISGFNRNGEKFSVSCCYAPSQFQFTKLLERYT